MIKIEGKEQMIERVLERFDFEKVHAAMSLFGWTWTHEGGERYVPDVPEMEYCAEKLIDSVMEHFGEGTYNSNSTGGFRATLDANDELTLEFILEWWSEQKVDEDDE